MPRHGCPRERKPVPLLKDFAQRFIDAVEIRCAEKPRTIAFYAEKLHAAT
jgi:hypothetical protein